MLQRTGVHALVDHAYRWAALVVCAAALGGCGTSKPTNPIPDAYKACGSALNAVAHPTSAAGQLGSPGVFNLQDGSLSISGVNDDEPEGLAAVQCILQQLNTPSTLLSQITTTTEAMGRQTSTRDGLTYVWSYGVQAGLDLTVDQAP